MPQYAYFDSTQTSPVKVGGWYNTDKRKYPNLPDSKDLLTLTAEQWTQTRSDPNGWAVENGTTLIPYVPPVVVPTLAQKAQALLNKAQISVESSTYPNFTGTFPINSDIIGYINSEMLSILYDNTFLDDETTLAWPDSQGLDHNMTIQQFPIFGKALGKWFSIIVRISQTNSGTFPPDPYVI